MPGLARPLSARARFLLRAALVAAWISGAGGGLVSCQRLTLYHEPLPAIATATAPETPVAPPSAAPSLAPSAAPMPAIAPAPKVTRPTLAEERLAAGLEALDRFRSTRLPLSIANLLLSTVLVFAAARTLSRRPGARAWLIQATVANALFTAVEFVVSTRERAYLLDRAMRIPEVAADPNAEVMRRLVPFVWGGIVALEAASFLGLAWVLARPSVVRELAPPAQDGSMPPSSADDEDV